MLALEVCSQITRQLNSVNDAATSACQRCRLSHRSGLAANPSQNNQTDERTEMIANEIVVQPQIVRGRQREQVSQSKRVARNLSIIDLERVGDVNIVPFDDERQNEKRREQYSADERERRCNQRAPAGPIDEEERSYTKEWKEQERGEAVRQNENSPAKGSDSKPKAIGILDQTHQAPQDPRIERNRETFG